MSKRDSPQGGAAGAGAEPGGGPRAGSGASDRDALAVPLWMLAAVVAGGLVADLEPNLLEEGIVVHIADRMAAGEHLYRDVIVHTAPLPYELLALLFRGFGAELEAARHAVIVFQAVATGVFFAAARRSGLGALAHVAAALVVVAPLLLFPLFSTYFYTTLAFYLALIAIYPGLRAREGTGWALLAGITVAAVALCKQSTGLVLAAGFALAIFGSAAPGTRMARLAGFAVGGLALALATLGLYAVRGDLDALLFAQIELPLAIAAGDTFRMPFINLWPPGSLAPAIEASWVMYLPNLYYLGYGLQAEHAGAIVLLTQLLYALPFVALAASALRLLPVLPAPHALRLLPVLPAPHPALWLNGAVLLAMTTNLFPRGDWGHLVVALPPALAQLLWLGARRERGAASGRARVALACSLVAVLLAGGALAGILLRGLAGPASLGPRVPLRPVSALHHGPALPRVVKYLLHYTQPGDPIFVPRQEPLLYFATSTRNPTPFPGVLPGQRELQEAAILTGLERVRWVAMSDLDQPVYTRYADELPGVQAYLERYFEIPDDFPIDDASWISVLARRPDRGATALDLIHWPARAWIRDEQGRMTEPSSAPPERVATQRLRRPLPLVLGALGGGLDFELEVPEHAVFQSGVGFRWLTAPGHQYTHPVGATVVVSVARQGPFEELAVRSIDDGPRAGRRWTPLAVDLAAYAGERITLRLEVRADAPLAGERLAWWGSPRIALRPGSE